MTEVAFKINTTLREAETVGSWAEYAVSVLGVANTGDEMLDEYLAELYEANEAVHRRANQLAQHHDLNSLVAYDRRRQNCAGR